MLQKTQKLLTKGIIPLIQLMNKALKEEEHSEMFDLATDSLQLLAYTHRDISNIRRKFLKPAVTQKYKRLCSSKIPLTANLLGDDLDKQLKAINDQKKIGVKVTMSLHVSVSMIVTLHILNEEVMVREMTSSLFCTSAGATIQSTRKARVTTTTTTAATTRETSRFRKGTFKEEYN